MTRIGREYGRALYSLALEENASREILSQIKALDEAFLAEPDFLRLLCAYNLPKKERCQIIDDSFRGKVHLYVLNFLKLLAEKGYARHFLECVASYEAQYNADNGILTVTAITAVALSPEQLEKLSGKLARITGKIIMLTNRVDPAVLGGVRLDFDCRRVDGTVSHRLDAVHSLLKNTVL